MSQQIINLGTGPDTQTGDSLYSAFTKVNDNFTELYSVFDGNGISEINANTITANNISLATNVRTGNLFAYGNIESVGYVVTSGVFYPNGVAIGSLTAIDTDLIPLSPNIYNIGDPVNRFDYGYFNNGISVTGNVSAGQFLGNFAGNITGNITAGGADTDVMFNKAGSVNGDAGLRYDYTNKVLVAANLSAGTSNVFIVNGQRVGINTSSFVDGAILQINSTDSILLPVGDSEARPANAQPGMLRFNSLLSDIEYFDGQSWAQPITQFTISVANAQPGTGSQTTFDLPVANATTAGTIVSVNGIVQQPITSYSITGNVVTFTEAPSPNDIIDFRIITTSSTLTGITDVYGTTGLYLDQTTPGDQLITFKNADVDTLLIEANGQVRITSNINSLSQDYRNGSLVVDGSAGFAGNVSVNGILYGFAKNFLIDHPSKPDHKLQYSSLEGPEFGVYVRGKLKGTSIISLPDYWKDLVDENSISVTLTPCNYYQELYVAEIKNNKVYISNELENDINCFYTVWAERKDLDKLVVEYRK